MFTMTTSLYLHCPQAMFISSVRTPKMSFINPSFFKSVRLLSDSSLLSYPILHCRKLEAKSHVDETDWEKWVEHCAQNDQQAKLLSDLKSQYTSAIDREDYENAAGLQGAITEATKDDAVGRVMSNLNNAVKEERYEDATFLRDNTCAGLLTCKAVIFLCCGTIREAEPCFSDRWGWWAGVSEDHKYPYGQIIHITAEHGRFLAKSYSPWQLATAKDGTPLFEIYVSSSKEGKYEEQAVYLMHKEAPNDSFKAEDMKLDVRLSHLTPYPSQDLWAETLWRCSVATGSDNTKEEFKDLFIQYGMNMKIEGHEATELAKLSGEEKAVFCHEFAVGGIADKATKKFHNDFLRLPAMLERKACFSLSLSVDENNTSVDDNIDQQVSGEHSLEDYRTLDHAILDHVDCMGRGIFKKHEGHDRLWPFVLSQAQNQQPLLSGLTTFNRIEVPAYLGGLYIGSNGFLVTEVIQIRHKFGHWQEDGDINDVSKLEPCEYVEVVKLTGDVDVLAGQIAFRAKVGEKYKLSPWYVLEKTYGAVARYKGRGRLPGFQKSGWVDVELFIIGEKYRKDGFAIGFLYSAAPDYYYLKLFKQLRLPSSGESH